MKPNISIIIAVYNTPESYLKKCIDSIVNQSLKNIEIIIVNDGSNIKTSKICEQYVNEDTRVKLINQSNMGESGARNSGMFNAITQNIMFVDSDDWIEENTCEKLNNYIDKINGKYDIIIFNTYVDYDKKQIKNRFYLKEGYLNGEDIEQIQLQNIEKGVAKYYPPETNISTAWAKIYNKKFIDVNNLKYTLGLPRMADAVFNMEAFEKANDIFVYPDFLYHYQKNEFSICNKFSPETVNYYEKYIEIVQEYIQKYNKNQQFSDTLNIKIVTSIDNYMYNYFFNKDNVESYEDKKKELKNLLKKELYVNAMQRVKPMYLSTYQKLVLKNAQRKNVFILKMLSKIKRIIKGINKKHGGV